MAATIKTAISPLREPQSRRAQFLDEDLACIPNCRDTSAIRVLAR
jgi:hypothetical protein